MITYHKINSVYKRDSKGNFIIGEYSCQEFQYLESCDWVWTEKVDGMNTRVIWDGESIELKFAGKSDNAQIPAKLQSRLSELFPIDKFYGRPSLCLYGEGYGAKIQKGGGNYNPDGNDFVLFDVKVDRWWLKRDAVEGIAKDLGVDVVPEIGVGTLPDAIEFAKQGFSSNWGNFLAEGLVLRPLVELQARNGDRIITKVKYKDFNHLR